MADELPNVGDLARVVRVCGCCDASRALLDRFVTVAEIRLPESAICGRCGKDFGVGELAITEPDRMGFRRDALQRVPPLADLESIEIADELDAERSRERVTA
jgi:superfamily II helicase